MTLFQAFLSLSKLSLLASRPSEGVKSKQLDILNTFLQHIEVQEELPPDVVAASGMDYDTMPPLSPQRIIEVSINNICTYSGTWKKVDGLRRSCGTIWPKFWNGCQGWSCHCWLWCCINSSNKLSSVYACCIIENRSSAPIWEPLADTSLALKLTTFLTTRKHMQLQ